MTMAIITHVGKNNRIHRYRKPECANRDWKKFLSLGYNMEAVKNDKIVMIAKNGLMFKSV